MSLVIAMSLKDEEGGIIILYLFLRQIAFLNRGEKKGKLLYIDKIKAFLFVLKLGIARLKGLREGQTIAKKNEGNSTKEQRGIFTE